MPGAWRGGRLRHVADDISLQVIDVANPAALVGGAAITPAGLPGAWQWRAATLTWRMILPRVIDVANPGGPVRVGGYDTSRPLVAWRAATTWRIIMPACG